MSDKDPDMVKINKAMRALSDDERAEAINSSPNVIGFDRFTQKAQQVALREAYRKPIKGDD